jgi:hypothetical protein
MFQCVDPFVYANISFSVFHFYDFGSESAFLNEESSLNTEKTQMRLLSYGDIAE